jgi:hypothetical protein
MEEDVPYWNWCQKAKRTGHWIKKNIFWALEHYPLLLQSPYHTYGLPMRGRCSLLSLGSKGQMSSALVIEVEI